VATNEITVWFWDASGLAYGYTRHDEHGHRVVRHLLDNSHGGQIFRMATWSTVELFGAFIDTLPILSESDRRDFESLLYEDMKGRQGGRAFDLMTLTSDAAIRARELMVSYRMNVGDVLQLAVFLESVKYDRSAQVNQPNDYFFVTGDKKLGAAAEYESKSFDVSCVAIIPSTVSLDQLLAYMSY